MAHMVHPSAPYLSLGIRLSRPIDSGSPLVSPGGDPIVGPFQVPPGKAEGRLRAVAPCFLRRSIGQGTFHRVGIESDQLVNICSFAVHYDRRWPSTQ